MARPPRVDLVGAAGFEPTTPSPPDWCANQGAPRSRTTGGEPYKRPSRPPQNQNISDPMKLATWNVNSIKVRLEAATHWLKEALPDVVVLQEIKCQDDAFPKAALEEL